MENKTSPNEWEQMAKYLASEMGEAEKNDFEKYLSENKSKEEILLQSKDAFSMTNNYPLKKKLDADSAWAKLANRIENEEIEIKQLKTNWFLNNYMRIAALLIISLLVGFLTQQYFVHRNSVSFAANTLVNEQKDVSLPDQSTVSLNSNTKISYSKASNKNQRSVELEGEAFFKVHRDVKTPFVITTENAEIKVLGTSFNVNSRPQVGQTEVCVKTGKVRVTSKTGQFIDLVANQKVILQNNQFVKLILENENYLAWKSKKLVFNNQPTLKEVISLVNQEFDSNVELKEDLPELKMSNTTFDHYTLNQTLEVLISTFDLKKEDRNGKIILSKK